MTVKICHNSLTPSNKFAIIKPLEKRSTAFAENLYKLEADRRDGKAEIRRKSARYKYCFSVRHKRQNPAGNAEVESAYSELR
jgi:hypothetical protein